MTVSYNKKGVKEPRKRKTLHGSNSKTDTL